MTADRPTRRPTPILAGLVLALALAVGIPSAIAAIRAAQKPVNTARPMIYASSTTFRQHDVVSASVGSWTGTPTIYYTFQWLRCSTPVFTSCSPIPGAKKPVYTITSADVNQGLIMQVKAHNNGGTTFALSQMTPTGVSTALHDAVPPSVRGSAVVGAQLTADPGTWTSAQPITFTYQWTRCTSGGCSPIAGAKLQSYTVAAADQGHSLFVQIKATSGGKVVFLNSSRTKPVAAAPAAPPTTTTTATTGPVNIASVALPDRLVVSNLQFSPSKLHSHDPFVARFRVTNHDGRPVQGALVYALGIPYSWVASGREVPTDADGWATTHDHAHGAAAARYAARRS